jgi:hypothetical protein
MYSSAEEALARVEVGNCKVIFVRVAFVIDVIFLTVFFIIFDMVVFYIIPPLTG